MEDSDREQIELLETLHQFPCEFTFKVIGRAQDSFVERVVAVVRQEIAVDAELPYRTRETAAGRHVSVTLEPTVTDAAMVIAIFASLRNVDGVHLVM